MRSVQSTHKVSAGLGSGQNNVPLSCKILTGQSRCRISEYYEKQVTWDCLFFVIKCLYVNVKKRMPSGCMCLFFIGLNLAWAKKVVACCCDINVTLNTGVDYYARGSLSTSIIWWLHMFTNIQSNCAYMSMHIQTQLELYLLKSLGCFCLSTFQHMCLSETCHACFAVFVTDTNSNARD